MLQRAALQAWKTCESDPPNVDVWKKWNTAECKTLPEPQALSCSCPICCVYCLHFCWPCLYPECSVFLLAPLWKPDVCNDFGSRYLIILYCIMLYNMQTMCYLIMLYCIMLFAANTRVRSCMVLAAQALRRTGEVAQEPRVRGASWEARREKWRLLNVSGKFFFTV